MITSASKGNIFLMKSYIALSFVGLDEHERDLVYSDCPRSGNNYIYYLGCIIAII